MGKCAERWMQAGAVVVAALVGMVVWPVGADAEVTVAAPSVGPSAPRPRWTTSSRPSWPSRSW
jgi:hypothetical protein